MSEQVSLEGAVETIVFQNAENGFVVFSLRQPGDDPEELVCVGNLPGIIRGETLKVTGAYVVHALYGRQFAVERYVKTSPADEASIIKFLGSGVIKGMRERMAKKIVERFGRNTLQIIEESPELLAQVKGITPERAMSIGAVFHEQAEMRRVMLYLQDFGVSPGLAMKIYRRYGSGVFEIIQTNPYALAGELWGVGFKTADSIAQKAGIAQDSPFRVAAGIRHTLSEALNNGHVFLPKGALLPTAAELLSLDAGLVERQLLQMYFDRVLLQETLDGETNIYLAQAYHAETYTARKLLELSAAGSVEAAQLPPDTEAPVPLAKNQREAVAEALRHGVLIVTGGPGTGKTTTINAMLRLLQQFDFSIELAAPTGRAAKRMTEATGMEAKTIHRLLEISSLSENSRNQTFGRNEDRPLEADVIIVDESSMVDLFLMASLLRAIPLGSRLILVGDVDQLPSVGPGSVLKDVIASGCVPVVRLTEIFRQAQESAIVMNAHRINRGEYPVLNQRNKDFFFVRRTGAEEVCATILDLVEKRLPAYAGCDSLQDIQVLSPMRKSPLGVHNLNRVLQARLNPPSPQKREKELHHALLREGDKVMQVKNNYNMTWRVVRQGRLAEEGLGVFNGDMGVIRTIDDLDERVTVCFEDRLVEYDYAQLDELELAYAITIHKSQGSEYKVVVISIHSGPPMLMSRNLLYTAVTRAKDLAVIVGLPATLYGMVDNNREVNRYSSLGHRLKVLKGMV